MNRKMASVTLTGFLRTEEKFIDVGMTKTAALPGFLRHLGLSTLQMVRGEGKF
jgi:hypothetical protein